MKDCAYVGCKKPTFASQNIDECYLYYKTTNTVRVSQHTAAMLHSRSLDKIASLA